MKLVGEGTADSWCTKKSTTTFFLSILVRGKQAALQSPYFLRVRGAAVFYCISLAKAVIPLPKRCIYRHYRTGQSSALSSAIFLFYYTLFSPLMYLPGCLKRFFIEMKSRPRVTIWVRLKEAYSYYDCLFPGGQWSAYQKWLALYASWSSDDELFSLVERKLDLPPKLWIPNLPESGTQRENWL